MSERMIAILTLCIISFLFIIGTDFTYGIFPAFLKSLGGTEIIISVGVSALYLTRGTSSFLTEKLAQKLSFKALFVIVFLGSAFSTFLITLPTDPLIAALLRAFQGIFSGIFWVLINIYAITLGATAYEKFRNLSIVTIFINCGSFIGSVISGRIATHQSAYISFYIGIIMLLIGGLFCLLLTNIKQKNIQTAYTKKTHILPKEKLIIVMSVVSSVINAYLIIAIPIYILQLGGSFKEIGITSGMSILAAALIVSIAPFLKRLFSYRTIMVVDYLLIVISLFMVFFFKSIFLIYFLQSILVGVVTLERNLWYSVLQEHSNNFNKSISILRGIVDYVSAAFFIFFGYLIHTLGSLYVALFMCMYSSFLIYVVFNYRKLHFLKYLQVIKIHSFARYDHNLYRA